jgi:hypothetical protein
VGISLRDERGQGVVEYVLVLVVSVSIILGALYQLNSVFKLWANNYFGNYLSCLLETGELPALSGDGGGTGICNQQYKAFSLADGRPLIGKGGAGETGGDGGSGEGDGGGQREGGKYAGGGGGGGGGYTRIGDFGSRFTGSSAGGAKGSRRGSASAGGSYTGSTEASDYGTGGGSAGHKTPIGLKSRIDTRFAFDESQTQQKPRSVASTTKKDSGVGPHKSPIRLHGKDVKKSDQATPDSGFTISNFIRFLIIAAIIIALVLFLGGQALQIGKSMDSGE